MLKLKDGKVNAMYSAILAIPTPRVTPQRPDRVWIVRGNVKEPEHRHDMVLAAQERTRVRWLSRIVAFYWTIYLHDKGLRKSCDFQLFFGRLHSRVEQQQLLHETQKLESIAWFLPHQSVRQWDNEAEEGALTPISGFFAVGPGALL